MLFKPPFTDSLKGAKVWKHYRNMHCTSELCFLSIFIFGHRPNIKVFIKITLIFNKTINFIWLKTILNEFLWWFMLGRVLLIVIKSWYLISAAKLLCGHTVSRSNVNDLVKKNVNKSFTIFYLLMGNLTTNFDLPITKTKDLAIRHIINI